MPINDRTWRFEASHGSGRVHCPAGMPDEALAHHRDALRLAVEHRPPDDQARANDGAAYAYHALGRLDLARQHWQHAIDLLVELDLEYTDDVEATVATIRTQLASLAV
ncbi:MAG TPA: tetratricopeptide repeat protein [Natronosporangium sp.]